MKVPNLLLVLATAAAMAGACDNGDGTTDAIGRDFVVGSEQNARTPTVLEDDETLDGASDAALELLGLLDRGLLARYAAIYQTVAPEGEATETYVVYNLPPLARVDTIPVGETDADSMLVASEGGAAASCSRDGDTWQCDAVEDVGGGIVVSFGPVIYPSADDLLAATITEVAGRDIAGQPTRCFDLLPPETQVPLTYCVNTDGVVLFHGADFRTVEALSYSTTVGEDDFLLPLP